MTQQGAKTLKKDKIIDDEQLNIFDNNFIVSGFAQPLMPVFTQFSPLGLTLMHWGLIPDYTKNNTEASFIRMKTLNARAETLFERPAYKKSALKMRCIVPATGFFEWKKVGKFNYPYFISPANNSLFFMAAIWSKWTNPESEKTVKTFSVVTSDANELMAEIHTKKRMPLLLSQQNAHCWLRNDIEENEVKQLLHPLQSNAMKTVSVKKFSIAELQKHNKQTIQEFFFYPELNQQTLF